MNTNNYCTFAHFCGKSILYYTLFDLIAGPQSIHNFIKDKISALKNIL